MATIRRWYLLLVCAVSLQSVTWATITLLRNLLTRMGEAPLASFAFQIAVLIIGLPIFLFHWVWAQRLATQSPDEHASALRRLYLYGTLAGFLLPFLVNAFGLATWVLSLLFRQNRPLLNDLLRDVVALAVLALLWFYHYRIVVADTEATPDSGNVTLVRRFYLLGLSVIGLTMTAFGGVDLLRWIMFQFGGNIGISANVSGVVDTVAQLVVGLPVWLIFWTLAQRLFAGPSDEERESVLRKFYLYAIVFVTVLSSVTNATLILAGSFRSLLGLPSIGDIRSPISIIVGATIFWAYHAMIVRQDAAMASEAPQQAGVRRLYLYLVAAIGLGAFLIGTGGDISVLIRGWSSPAFNDALREQLAWYTAALIAGLPVWVVPWRRILNAAEAQTAAGVEERHSLVRRIYLYFYLFVATMTVLAGAVYIVYRILNLILGGTVTGNLLTDIGQALAFTLMGIGVWLYHGALVRKDTQFEQQELAQHLANLRVAIVDIDEEAFSEAVIKGLQHEFPSMILDAIRLTATTPADPNQASIPTRLAQANLIVGPWAMAIPGGNNGIVTAEIARAITDNPAPKLLTPVRSAGWEWVGVDRWNHEALVQQTVHAVKQFVAGEAIQAVRPNMANLLAIVILVIIIVPILLLGVSALFGGM